MDSPGKESSRPGEGATTKASNGFAYDRIVKRVGGIELRYDRGCGLRSVADRRIDLMAITAFKGTNKGPPPDCCPSLDFWYEWNSCPETGSGERLVHKWVFKAAHACKHFKLTPEQAHDWTLERMTREPDTPREIPDTLAQVY